MNIEIPIIKKLMLQVDFSYYLDLMFTELKKYFNIVRI